MCVISIVLTYMADVWLQLNQLNQLKVCYLIVCATNTGMSLAFVFVTALLHNCLCCFYCELSVYWELAKFINLTVMLYTLHLYNLIFYYIQRKEDASITLT